MEEIWREIPGFDGEYLISNLGNAASNKKGKFKLLKLYPMNGGLKREYLGFRTSFNGVRRHVSVSRSVAKAFPEICGEWFDGCTVDHINTIKTDNRPENLRVVTMKENMNNPLTIAKIRGYKTDEERAEHKKQQKKEHKKRCSEYYKKYYKNYFKEYYKKPEAKEKRKELAKKRYYDNIQYYREKARERYYKKKAMGR